MSSDADRPRGQDGSVTSRESAEVADGIDAASLGGPEAVDPTAPPSARRTEPRHHDVHGSGVRRGHEPHLHEHHHHHVLIEPEEDRWRWRRKIRENPSQLAVYRVAVAIAGLIFVVLGVVTGPLPGPGTGATAGWTRRTAPG